MAEQKNDQSEGIIEVEEAPIPDPMLNSVSMDLNGTADVDKVNHILSENSLTVNSELEIRDSGEGHSLCTSPKYKQPSTDDSVFMIPPLLRVRQSSAQERIPINAEEIKRRLGSPENLSEAHLLNLLRLNKEGTKNLKPTLEQIGINELSDRSSVVSSFSRLSEAEAEGLAEDYYYLASRFMKVRDMNKTIAAENGGEAYFPQKAKSTRLILEQTLSEIERRGSDLSLATHGFSPLALRAVVNILIEILNYREKDSVIDNSERAVNL